MGSFSLLQGIFLTQELNRGLLHYRRVLYQLSYQETPLLLQYASTKKQKTVYSKKFIFILRIQSSFIKMYRSKKKKHEKNVSLY